jgi:hypothetical protein
MEKTEPHSIISELGELNERRPLSYGAFNKEAFRRGVINFFLGLPNCRDSY